jgi:hypothetical protein
MSISAVEHCIRTRCPGRFGGKVRTARVNPPSTHFAFGGFLLIHRHQLEIGGYRHDRICNIGSPGLKMCVRPSAGALKITKEIIGHHSVRIKAGTAIGVVSVGSV